MCDLQDRLNYTTMAGPHDMSSNDLLCSILWHVTCMVRHRSDSDTSRFYLPLDLRQMHAPDAYFGNAQCVQSITGVGTFLTVGEAVLLGCAT